MAEWTRVVEASRVTDGNPFGTTIDGTPVGIFRVDDRIFAINNVCTHAFALLTNGFQEGCLVECPLHAGFFDIRTGKAQGTPVEKDVAVYDAKVEDGFILVRLT